ncbi:hypothetical protein LCGC14_2552950, partial [marine sediment metagenome]
MTDKNDIENNRDPIERVYKDKVKFEIYGEEMIEKRAKLIKDARALITAAQTEKRSMTDEENVQYDKMFKAQDGKCAICH